MPLHLFCGDVVDSDIALPELTAAGPHDEPRRLWTVRRASLGAGRLTPAPGSQLLHRWLDEAGAPVLHVHRDGTAYVLTFSVGIDARVDHARIVWEAIGTLPLSSVRHVLINQLLPLAMSARGDFVLHASAVRIGGAAVVFAGATGQGKSTLAAACRAARHEVLADDCVRVDMTHGGARIQPASREVRLWPDAGAVVARAAGGEQGASSRVPQQDGADAQGVELRRLYVLEWSNDAVPRVRPATAAAVVDLQRFVFRVDPRRRDHAAGDFERLTRLVGEGMVRRLAVPRALSALRDVVAAIEDDVNVAVSSLCA